MTPRQQLRELINKHLNAQLALASIDDCKPHERDTIREDARKAERDLETFISNHRID